MLQGFLFYRYKKKLLRNMALTLLLPPFLLFQKTAVQTTILFLFRLVDKILQTGSVVKNAAKAATIQEDMAVSDRLK